MHTKKRQNIPLSSSSWVRDVTAVTLKNSQSGGSLQSSQSLIAAAAAAGIERQEQWEWKSRPSNPATVRIYTILVTYYSNGALNEVHSSKRFVPLFPGKTFPQKGQTVTVHYVGKMSLVALWSKVPNKFTFIVKNDKVSCP